MSVTKEEVASVIRTDINSIVTAWQAKYGINLPTEPKMVLVEAISQMMEAGVEGMLKVIGEENDSSKETYN